MSCWTNSFEHAWFFSGFELQEEWKEGVLYINSESEPPTMIQWTYLFQLRARISCHRISGILRSRDRHSRSRVVFWSLRRVEYAFDFMHFWKMRPVEWDIGRKHFERREEYFIPKALGRPDIEYCRTDLVSYTRLGVFRPPIFRWS